MPWSADDADYQVASAKLSEAALLDDPVVLGQHVRSSIVAVWTGESAADNAGSIVTSWHGNVDPVANIFMCIGHL